MHERRDQLGICAAVGLVLLFPMTLPLNGQPVQTNAKLVSQLQEVGSLYASQFDSELKRLEILLVRELEPERDDWVERLERALAVGYAPPGTSYQPVYLDDLDDMIVVLRSEEEGIRESLAAVLAQGDRVIGVAWYFRDLEQAAESFAVVDSNSEVLFDTLISLPVLKLPILSLIH